MQDASYQAIITTPVGKIGIHTSEDHLLSINYLYPTTLTRKPTTLLAKETVEQLLCYFADPHFVFDLPLTLSLTPFEQKLIRALQKISISKTCSYSDLAQKLHTHPRPIGNACRKNPIPIIIPCHRVVAMHNLGGYHGVRKGPLLDIKRWLLKHEDCKRILTV